MTAPGGAVVVVPSHRELDWTLFSEVPEDVPMIVVDDSDHGLAPPQRPNTRVVDRRDQVDLLGARAAAMPRRSAACRNFGHLLAYREGFRVVLALDYDCRPAPGWVEQHLTALGEVVSAPALRAPWVNTIEGTGQYARGFPYEYRDDEVAATPDTVSGTGRMNVGVWSGILDLNGVDKLATKPPTSPGDRQHRSTVALGNLPVCGMNLAIHREVVPALFFLPDIQVNGWQMSRHDDIWGGYVAKKLMDLRGDLVSFGRPVVEHTRQTDLDRVVTFEHYVHLLSPHFYRLVDEAAARVAPADYPTMFARFCVEFGQGLRDAVLPEVYRRVFVSLLAAMRAWSACFTD